MNESGLCECGCGLPTENSKCTNLFLGIAKGRPNRFINGHQAAFASSHAIPQSNKEGLVKVTGEPPAEKKCSGCEKIKPLSEFESDRRRSFGKGSRCKACHSSACLRIPVTLKRTLNRVMHVAICISIRRGSKNRRRWEKLVGYTADDLKIHLEKRFTPGMSWANYGALWEIDHIIPKAVFNFTTPEDIDFKRCWELKNLQPLEARKNRSKGAHIDKPFQPALTIQL